MKKLRIALTKGRLEQKTVELLERAGLNCAPLRDKGRKLIAEIAGAEFVFAKAADVVTYVEYGVADLGVVGKDTLMEADRRVCEVLDLGFGACRFALAALKGSEFYKGYETKTVATKYPRVAKRFFERKNLDVDIIRIEGSVELAPLLKLADGIVDIVETGTTLRENGLEVIETVADISARLIANPASYKLKRAEIEAFSGLLSKSLTEV